MIQRTPPHPAGNFRLLASVTRGRPLVRGDPLPPLLTPCASLKRVSKLGNHGPISSNFRIPNELSSLPSAISPSQEETWVPPEICLFLLRLLSLALHLLQHRRHVPRTLEQRRIRAPYPRERPRKNLLAGLLPCGNCAARTRVFPAGSQFPDVIDLVGNRAHTQP